MVPTPITGGRRPGGRDNRGMIPAKVPSHTITSTLRRPRTDVTAVACSGSGAMNVRSTW